MRFPPFLKALFSAVLFPLVLGSDADAAEKTHAYFRFTPTRLRDTPGLPNSVQVSEFKLRFRGATVDMAQASVTNPGGNTPATEGAAKLTDGLASTKWLDFNKRAVVFQFPQAVSVDGYSFTTANDSAERDPANWRLEGSDDGTSWVLLDEVINGSVPTARITATAEFPLAATVPPYTSFWHPDYLLKWSPAIDSSADFNKSTVPLAARSANAALKVNANSRPNEGKVAVLTTFGSTSFLPSQGSAVEHFNAYTGWQYTDKLIFWGGSAGEGLILAPAAPVTDAAHRNGVPVLGTVFFPPAAYGGQFHWVQTFLQKSGSTFPVADKLIEVARAYGFEGWFINQETAGGNSTDSVAMRDFISYFRSQAPELQIMWYDAMTEGGGISWQNALTGSNDMFVGNASQPVAHSMFLNFWWSSGGLSNSRTLAQSLGVNPYAIYAGVDVESAGSGTTVDWEALFPSGQAHKLSLAFYGAQSMFRNTGNPADFQNSEQRFWVGANNDPSNTATAAAWKGIAHYVPPSTPLQKLPFVTNFNRGQGNRFAVDGTVLGNSGWNNLSLQDVLPTWRWIVSSTGTKLTPSLELDDAYSGGTSLKIAGTLDAPNDLKLYAASLPVGATTKFRLVYKSSQGTGATSMKVALSFEDAPQALTYFDVGNAGAAGWRTFDVNLGSYAGKKIATIGLRFENAAAISSYQMRIGRIAVFDGAVSTPAAAANVRVVRQDAINADTLAVRLKWDVSTTAGIYYYQIIQRFPDNTRKWLGATPGNAFFMPAARRKGGEASLTFEVQAVGADFGISPVASLSVALPPAPDITTRLAGTWIGTPGSWSNLGDTGDRAYDGNPATFFDAQEESAWTGLDFGSGRARRITAIRYIPRAGWAFRSTNGVFEAANLADFSDAVNLHTIPVEPADGVYTTISVIHPGLFRYFRYRSNGHGNIGDISVYGYEIPATPAAPTANVEANGISVSWAAAARAKTYRLERGGVAGGPFTILGETTSTAFNDSTAPAGQRPFYRVTSVNPAGTSAASATAQAVSAYLVWRTSAFGGETSPSVIGADADPDKDLMPNLLEYVLGLNPLVPDGVGFQPQVISGRLAIIYPQLVSATEITLKAQWTDGLGEWSDSGVVYEVLSESGGKQQIQATAPPGGEGRRFMRLRAETP
ncbi:MAG: hypothetical protein V4584_17500 [Verrucomicrobiota bacterium]